MVATLCTVCAGEAYPQAAQDSHAEGSTELKCWLEDLIVPYTEFRQARVQDAIAQLHKDANHLRTDHGRPVALTLRVEAAENDVSSEPTRVSLQIRDAPLMTLVNIVAREGKLRVEYGEDSVTFVSTNRMDDFEFYQASKRPPRKEYVSLESYLEDLLELQFSGVGFIPETVDAASYRGLTKGDTYPLNLWIFANIDFDLQRVGKYDRLLDLNSRSFRGDAEGGGVTIELLGDDGKTVPGFEPSTWYHQFRMTSREEGTSAVQGSVRATHWSFPPRTLPVGKYTLRARCRLSVDLIDGKEVFFDLEGTTPLRIVTVSPQNARVQFYRAWISAMRFLDQVEAGSELAVQRDRTLEWCIEGVDREGLYDPDVAFDIVLTAFAFKNYELTETHLLRYLSLTEGKYHHSRPHARDMLPAVREIMRRENRLEKGQNRERTHLHRRRSEVALGGAGEYR